MGIKILLDGWFLYDKTAHTDQWDEPVYCDVLWLFDWEDVPRPIQDYIINKAMQLSLLITLLVTKVLSITTRTCTWKFRATALEYEAQQGDYTFFGHPTGQNYYNSYQPFHTLYR